MAFEFDFSQTPDDPTKIQDGFGGRVAPGRGMALISEWEEYGLYDSKAHKLGLEIVAWTVPSEVAKVHEEGIFHKDTTGKGFPMRRMTCLAMAAGLFTAEDVKKWKSAGTQPEIDMSKIVERPIMIELVEEPDSKDATKKYIKIGNIGLAFYHIKDPRVKDWPRNQSVYNRCAAVVGDWVTETNAAPSETKTAKRETAPAEADPFAGVI